MQQDEYALQATAHRAQARVLEAELEALENQYAAVEKDNQQLRSTVYRYIYAMEHDPAHTHDSGQFRAIRQGEIGDHDPEANALFLLQERGVALRQSLNEQQEELQLLVQVR